MRQRILHASSIPLAIFFAQVEMTKTSQID